MGSLSRLLLFLAGLLAAAFTASGAKAAEPRAARQTFDLAAGPPFSAFRAVVEAYARKPRPSVANDFCLLGERASDDSRHVWVIWLTGRRLILWEGGDDLETSRRDLDLRKDVVATDDEIAGSTYLISRPWFDELTAACEKARTKVHVDKSRRSVSKR